MSVAFDLLYKLPRDPTRERRVTSEVLAHGGRLDRTDETAIENAEQCAVVLRGHGEHVEGPYEYGG